MFDAFRAIFHGPDGVKNLNNMPGQGWTANATIVKGPDGVSRIVTAAHNVGSVGRVAWKDGGIDMVQFQKVGSDLAVSVPVGVVTELRLGHIKGIAGVKGVMQICHRQRGCEFEAIEVPVVDLGIRWKDINATSYEVMEVPNNPAIRVGASGAPVIVAGEVRGVFHGPMDKLHPELGLPPVRPGRRRILVSGIGF